MMFKWAWLVARMQSEMQTEFCGKICLKCTAWRTKMFVRVALKFLIRKLVFIMRVGFSCLRIQW